eukprot:CAMPEP_0169063564 /NCGR_PEP_ID=MMETSP1015-20121227/1355_1 /TAXON_ID=342587 /ORGANISM="Karlodinium micrum, Strain CCMP2283" /LENGTH=55 /DNA_ID=CAMNT_0009121915 /DNA_START=116 /DNA_END=283 /DNA_ORIENTATION=-
MAECPGCKQGPRGYLSMSDSHLKPTKHAALSHGPPDDHGCGGLLKSGAETPPWPW